MENDLSEYTWLAFSEQKKAQIDSVLLYDLTLTSDEVSLIQSIMRNHFKNVYNPDWDLLRRQWSYDGIFFLSCFVYAKYVRSPNEKFWDGWRKWTGEESSLSANNGNHYNEIKKFASQHSLFLYETTKKTMYVSSFSTHAFFNAAHCVDIYHFLKIIAIGNPYRMDVSEQKELLAEIIQLIANRVKFDQSEKEEEIDEIDSIKNFYRLHRGFRRACLNSSNLVLRAIEIPFRMILSTVLSGGTTDFLAEYQSNLEQFQIIGYQQFMKELSEETQDLQKFLGKRTTGKKRFFRPEYRFNFEEKQLEIWIPEMRIETDLNNVEIRVIIQGDNLNLSVPIEPRLYRSFCIGTEEKHIVLERFDSKIVCDIQENNVSVRSFSLNEKFLIFDIEGDVLPLPCRVEQEAFLLVPHGTYFDEKEFSIYEVKKNANYRIFQFYMNEDSCFILGDSIISPFFSEIPNFRILDKYLVDGVFLSDDIGLKISVYSEFPIIQIRAENREQLRIKFPLLINEQKYSYDILAENIITDGSGESCFTVGLSDDIKKTYLGQVVSMKMGGCCEYKAVFIVLRNLSKKFTQDYYIDEDDIRVAELSFDNSDKLFIRSYIFPMKDNNVRFKLSINDKEFKLCLAPPCLDVRFCDGTYLNKDAWHSLIASKTLSIVNTLAGINLMARYDTGEERVFRSILKDGKLNFDLQFLHRDNTFANKVEIYACFLAPNTKKQEKLCTVYSRFTVLSPLKFSFISEISSIKNLIKETGQYLTMSYIGEPSLEYTARLLNIRNGKQKIFMIPESTGVPTPIRISNGIVEDGIYTFSVVSKKMIMGMKSCKEQIEYSQENIEILSGEIKQTIKKDSKDIIIHNKFTTKSQLHYLEIEETKIEIGTIINCIETFDGHAVRNFYLKIYDESVDGSSYLADGFFVIDGSNHYHTKFNPYNIQKIQFHNKDIHFEITDKDGRSPDVDSQGKINPLSTNNRDLYQVDGMIGYFK